MTQAVVSAGSSAVAPAEHGGHGDTNTGVSNTTIGGTAAA